MIFLAIFIFHSLRVFFSIFFSKKNIFFFFSNTRTFSSKSNSECNRRKKLRWRKQVLSSYSRQGHSYDIEHFDDQFVCRSQLTRDIDKKKGIHRSLLLENNIVQRVLINRLGGRRKKKALRNRKYSSDICTDPFVNVRSIQWKRMINKNTRINQSDLCTGFSPDIYLSISIVFFFLTKFIN